MKHSIIAVLIITAFTGCSHNTTHPGATTDRVYQWTLATLDTLETEIAGLCEAIERGSDVQQRAFMDARRSYKKVEALAEMYAPETALQVNGPPVDRYDEYDPERDIPPEGFQVVEEYLFPTPDEANRSEALLEVRRLQSNIHRMKRMLEAAQYSESHIVEAMRLQVFRIATMGITGFDSPVALLSIPETRHALAGLAYMAEAMSDAGRKPSFLPIAKQCREAADFLGTQADFNEFNRPEFILNYLDPVLGGITAAREEYRIAPVSDITALSPDAKSIFEAGAIDPGFFVPAYAQLMTDAKRRLGRMLFFDPILSGNGERSCASCHQPDRGFTDGLPKSRALGGGSVQRNAPTMINAGYQSAFFYDMRVMYLEDQANDVIHNKDEMHGDLESAAQTLRRSQEYNTLFRDAFPGNDNDAIAGKNIRIALAAYIRSLSGLNSRVDRYMRGDHTQLSEEERRGFNLFMGQAKCATCHFPPLFNGAIPPRYAETEGEVIGVPGRMTKAHGVIDSDPGKYTLYRMEKDRHLFKIPTVRNAALTAPYMHNGAYTTLDDVVDFYNRGGGAGIGVQLPNATLPEDSLMLSQSDMKSIVAFMEALTDTSGLALVPSRLPALHKEDAVTRNPESAY